MAADEALIAWVTEALEPIGRVTKRAMMGGATLYLDGVVFAIVGSESSLWFKADATSDDYWDAAGCDRFTYTFADGRTGSMNYRRAPDEVHDDADAMRDHARIAIEADSARPGRRSADQRRGTSSGATSGCDSTDRAIVGTILTRATCSNA